MRFCVCLFKQTHPELLIVGAAEGQPHFACEMRPVGVGDARQLIINDNAAPLTVEKKPQQIATAAGGRSVHKQARNEVVPLRNHSQRAQEPAVAHATLQQIVGAESEVSDNDEVRQALPHIRARERGAISPCKELAAARFAVVVRPALVAVGVALNDGLCSGNAASAGNIRRNSRFFGRSRWSVDAFGAGRERGVCPGSAGLHGCSMSLRRQ